MIVDQHTLPLVLARLRGQAPPQQTVVQQVPVAQPMGLGEPVESTEALKTVVQPSAQVTTRPSTPIARPPATGLP